MAAAKGAGFLRRAWILYLSTHFIGVAHPSKKKDWTLDTLGWEVNVKDISNYS